MLVLLFLICYTVSLIPHIKISIGSVRHEYDFWTDVAAPLLIILIYALIAFLVLFAIQYLCCLMFKKKSLQNRFPTILIVEEAIVAAIVVAFSFVGMINEPPKGENLFTCILFIVSPFACRAGAVVARRLHRWIGQKKEKKAQALNPALQIQTCPLAEAQGDPIDHETKKGVFARIRDFLSELFLALGGLTLLFSTGLLLICLFPVLTWNNTPVSGYDFAVEFFLLFLPLLLGVSAMEFAVGTWLERPKGGVKIVSNIILSIGSLICFLYGLSYVWNIYSINFMPGNLVLIVHSMNENTKIAVGIVLVVVIYACLITQGIVFIKSHFSRKAREQYISV